MIMIDPHVEVDYFDPDEMMRKLELRGSRCTSCGNNYYSGPRSTRSLVPVSQKTTSMRAYLYY